MKVNKDAQSCHRSKYHNTFTNWCMQYTQISST